MEYDMFSDYGFSPKDWKDMLYNNWHTITMKYSFDEGYDYDKKRENEYIIYAEIIAEKLGNIGDLKTVVIWSHFPFEIRFEDKNGKIISYYDLEKKYITILNDKIHKVLNEN